MAVLLVGLGATLGLLALHGRALLLLGERYETQSLRWLRQRRFDAVVLLFFAVVLGLLLLHLLEIGLWALALRGTGLVLDLPTSLEFSGSTCLGLGVASNPLPAPWRLLAIFMVLGGTVNMAWTVSALVAMNGNFRAAYTQRRLARLQNDASPV